MRPVVARPDVLALTVDITARTSARFVEAARASLPVHP